MIHPLLGERTEVRASVQPSFGVHGEVLRVWGEIAGVVGNIRSFWKVQMRENAPALMSS
jgi:hypothetical protein